MSLGQDHWEAECHTLRDENRKLVAENERLKRLAYEGLCPVHDLGQEAPAECSCNDTAKELTALRARVAELEKSDRATLREAHSKRVQDGERLQAERAELEKGAK